MATDSLENPKHFWAYVRSRTCVKHKITSLRDGNGELKKDDAQTAVVMNEAFNGVFIEEDVTEPAPQPENLPVAQVLTTLATKGRAVCHQLRRLDADKAPGPDGISPFVLKACADLLSTPLEKIFQTSLDTGEVPSDWRKANITPIYKAGDKSCPLNYRPVSLTSVVAKVMEGLVRRDIVDHLTGHNILTECATRL